MDIKMRKISPADNFKSPDFLARRGLGGYRIVKKYLFSLKGILVTIVALGLSISAYILVSHGKQPPVDPNVAVQNETNDLTARIGKYMELPDAEQPTLVTVTDKAKLRGQDFFQHAQDGDKLLVYARAKKAILYRPSTGKIVDVTNLTSDDGSSS